jgi:hypothetical protein
LQHFSLEASHITVRDTFITFSITRSLAEGGIEIVGVFPTKKTIIYEVNNID